MKQALNLTALAGCLAWLSGWSVAADEDWPQWRGPNRNGISSETNLLNQWPARGPRLLWESRGAGEGYSSLSIAEGRIYTMGNRRGQEYVLAFDSANGQEVWAASLGRVRANGGGYPGPRCTPTVDQKRVFALGINGDLVSLDANTGREIWRRSFKRDFQGRMMSGWGYSESPLVDGDNLICTPGGPVATMLALDKKSGRVVWKSRIAAGVRGSVSQINNRQPDTAAYASMISAGTGRQKQYIQFLGTGVAGVSATNGRLLWRYNRPANGTANIASPIYSDGYLFAASEYDTGGGLVRLQPGRTAFRATEVYFTREMKNKHGGMVLVDGYIYGFDGGNLRCLDFKTGRSLWRNRSVGMGSVIWADGHLICRSQSGPVALVEATPRSYVEKGRFRTPNRSGQNTWAHPAISHGRLYLRDQDLLYCYDLRN